MTASGATATRPTAPAGVKPTIRLKAPQTGETVIEDQVQGRVVWQNENLDDLVLLRGDGNPTYMLAVVVDDHDMGVTHVIRGDDHLINAARQKQIYDAHGLDHPEHVAHPADPRRRTAQSCQSATARSASRPTAPWAICRPPCATIWCGSAGAMATRRSSPPQEMIEAFDLPASAARRHGSISPSWKTSTATTSARPTISALVEHVRGRADYVRAEWRRHSRPSSTTRTRAQLLQAMPGLKERAKTLLELIDSAVFHLRRPAARDRAEGRGAADRRQRAS